MNPNLPYHQQVITLAYDLVGSVHEVASANVLNYENIAACKPAPAVMLHAQLFMPIPAKNPCPVVVILPGSGGVSPVASLLIMKDAQHGFGYSIFGYSMPGFFQANL